MTDRSTPTGPPRGPQWGRPEPSPTDGHRRRTVLTHSLAALGGLVVGVLIGTVGTGGGTGGSQPPASPTPAASAPTASAPEASSPPRASATSEVTGTATVTRQEIPGDGTFLVGQEVRPGTYRSAGPADGSDCYWARLKGTTGAFSEIIANGSGRGQATVTILDSDKAVQTSGCQTWKRIG